MTGKIKSTVKRNLILLVTGLAVMSLICWGSEIKGLTQLAIAPQIAQVTAPLTTEARSLGRKVYQQLPDIPLENQYISRETGQAAVDNTLIDRLIRYHVYVKGRPTNFRLDWKLTLADYLGANEIMEESQYPSNDTLRQNPFEGDRAAINRLNRKQRDALVQTLANLFSPSDSNAPDPAASPQPATPPTDTPRLPQPQPGGADLLKP